MKIEKVVIMEWKPGIGYVEWEPPFFHYPQKHSDRSDALKVPCYGDPFAVEIPCLAEMCISM